MSTSKSRHQKHEVKKSLLGGGGGAAMNHSKITKGYGSGNYGDSITKNNVSKPPFGEIDINSIIKKLSVKKIDGGATNAKSKNPLQSQQLTQQSSVMHAMPNS